MKKRPLSIVIISILYVLAPIGNIIQVALVQNIPLIGPDNIWSRLLYFSKLGLIIYILMPFVAYGIYSVKKWGFYTLICFTLLLVVRNTYIYFQDKSYNFLTFLFLTLITSGVAIFFLNKHVMAPYFNPRIRWWEIPDRFKFEMQSEVIFNDGKVKSRITDFSKSGCFLVIDAKTPDVDTKFELGNIVDIKINSFKSELNLLGKLVRQVSHNDKDIGFGIMFSDMTTENKKVLKLLCETIKEHGLKDREELKSEDLKKIKRECNDKL